MSATTPNVHPLTDHDSRLWATLIQLGGILFPFLPALIGFVVLADRGQFLRQQSRSALNFQLTVLIGYVVGFFTVWIVVGFFVLLAVFVANIVFSILAAIETSTGENALYPIAIPFIRA